MEIIAKSFGKRENPLTNRCFRENIVNQMSSDSYHMTCREVLTCKVNS